MKTFSLPEARRDAVLGLAVAVVAVSVALLVQDPHVRTIVSTIAVYMIAATGFNVLSGFAGQMSLGHAGFLAVGAYTAAIGYREWEWPLLVSMIAGVVASGIVGALVAIPALRLHGPYLAMVTLAFGVMVYQFSKQFVEITDGPSGIGIYDQNLLPGISLSTDTLFMLVTLAAAVAVIITRNLVNSRWGRSLRALHSNDLVAESLGINVLRTRVIAFVFSASLTGLAGVLLAYQLAFVSPDLFIFHISIIILAVTMFGGLGSIWGPVVGAILLVGFETRFLAQTSYASLLYGIILLLVVMVAPQGIVGLLRKLRSRQKSEDGDHSESVNVPPVLDEEITTDLSPDMEHGKVILEAQGLSRTFGSLKAVDSVDFTARKGWVHGLIGPNGAGKSTLLDLITGTQRADEGLVRVRDEEVTSLPAYARSGRGLSRTFQTGGLFLEFSVIENVMTGVHPRLNESFFASLLHLPVIYKEERRARRRAEQLLGLVGLSGAARQTAGELSYGDRRLVEIARALAGAPKILFLDEPAAGLNPAEQNRLATILRRVAGTGICIVLVEHHMDLVMNLCDDIVVLEQGRRIAHGTPSDIVSNDEVVRAYLGTTGATAR